MLDARCSMQQNGEFPPIKTVIGRDARKISPQITQMIGFFYLRYLRHLRANSSG
jgi:hypothetical protein